MLLGDLDEELERESGTGWEAGARDRVRPMWTNGDRLPSRCALCDWASGFIQLDTRTDNAQLIERVGLSGDQRTCAVRQCAHDFKLHLDRFVGRADRQKGQRDEARGRRILA